MALAQTLAYNVPTAIAHRYREKGIHVRGSMPPDVHMHARLFYDSGGLQGEGWEIHQWQGDEGLSIAFSPEKTKGFVVFHGASEEDMRTIVKDIARERRDAIFANPRMRRYADDLPEILDLMRGENPEMEIKFAGHSLGGYMAKHFGREYGVDQELYNAWHVPWNRFPPNTENVQSVYHNIRTDYTSWAKYMHPMTTPNETHYMYHPPTSDWDVYDPHHRSHHFWDAGQGAQADAETGAVGGFLEAAGGGSKVFGAIGTALTAVQVEEDIRNKHYTDAAVHTAEFGGTVGAGMFLGMAAGATAGAAVGVVENARQAVSDFKQHDYVRGSEHAAETAIWGAATAASAFVGPAAILPALLASVAIEGGDWIAHKIKAKRARSPEQTQDAPAPAQAQTQSTAQQYDAFRATHTTGMGNRHMLTGSRGRQLH